VKITPLDIRRKEFKRSMRGYSDEQVDIFLDEVADEFERLFQENMELHDRVQRLEEQIAVHGQMRDALEKTLVSAQLQSEEIRANAHKESELILRDAQLKARGIINDSYGGVQQVQQTLVQLKRLEEEFRFKFRSLLEGYLNLLNEAPITTTAAQAAAFGNGATVAVAAPRMMEPVPEAGFEPEPGVLPEPQVSPALEPQPEPVVEPEPEPESQPVHEPQPVPVVVSSSEDEVPTEESELAAGDTEAVGEDSGRVESHQAGAKKGGTDEVTLGSLTASVEREGDRSGEAQAPRGFFFGRQLEDVDDTFPGEETLDKNRTRDFEW
jgi:cell division initiation protein